MKQKLDHVTNSSSVSFCGFGIEMECNLNIFPETIKRGAYNEYLEYMKDEDEKIWTYEEFLENDDDWYEYIYSLIQKNNLSAQIWWDADIIFIGKRMHTFPKDKTIEEVEQETQSILDSLGFNKKVKSIEESWRDG